MAEIVTAAVRISNTQSFLVQNPSGMKSTVRYQAAILQNDHLLLLKVWDHASTGRTFWVIPGGGRHGDETEEDYVKREAVEESHFQVELGRLILDGRGIRDGI